MTRLFNDPSSFVEEAVEGFVAANRRWVRAVPGGVVRRSLPAEPAVAVVIGGGSGHYPAFSGLVGAGLAHGAVVGNVFASPSADQVYRVAMSCQTGAGVLLTYGNYAGDVLNFDQAQARLVAEGIPCRTVLVTDDISSAPAGEMHRRRGIAGFLPVFKIAGAAADAGKPIEAVTELVSRANGRCRSLGVAFTGCTLPGADHRLFEVPAGRMGVGMGVHGEPGLREDLMPSAAGLAHLFVDGLLRERPAAVSTVSGARAVVILNGLGSVKYEELFVVYRSVARELDEAGITVVDAKVGEFVTSFDMAGASMTLLWLDDELEQLWEAFADAPAFKQGSGGHVTTPSVSAGRNDLEPAVDSAHQAPTVPAAADASRVAASFLVEALHSIRRSIDEQAGALGRIDSIAGDGDHGLGMQRGARAAEAAAEEARALGAGVHTVLLRSAEAWSNRGGGASGALWGAALRASAGKLSDDASPMGDDIAAAIGAAAEAVQTSGKARLGDKTMVDALEPFAAAFAESMKQRDSPAEAWKKACEAAARGAATTEAMVARVGRARPHGEKSVGTPDPGATSFVIVVRAVVPILASKEVPRA